MEQQPAQIEIFNLNGQQVLYLQSESEITELDVSSFMNGMYILKISSNEKIKRVKLIVQ